MKPGFGIRHATCFASLLVLLFLACGAPAAISQDAGAADESAKKWTYDEIKNAPEKARARRNPFANDSDATLAGGKLFGRHCAECHGLKAEGGKHAPSLLRDEVQKASDGALFWVLTNGVVWHGMPVWSKLPEPQRWQIVTFLKSFKALAPLAQ